jgi:small GTP-binding protein
MRRILDAERESILIEERAALGALRELLVEVDASSEDRATLDRSIRQLDELFLVVVVGEFNSGKSTLINGLLGGRFLKEGVTPTTASVQLLRYGEHDERIRPKEGFDERSLPVEFLRDTLLVDTPGTNALDQRHEAITTEFVPRADLVLFVTSADRPFSESERRFLRQVRDWGKKLVFAVNKVDVLRDEVERGQVTDWVTEGARDLLGVASPVFPVAARPALEARLDDDTAAFQGSGMGALEDYLLRTLDQGERLRLKLTNPLGVGSEILERYRAAFEERLKLLADDVTALADIDSQVSLFREDQNRQFEFRLTDIDKVLHAFEARGREFFAEHLRLARIFDLLDKERTRAAFERKVIADLPSELDQRVQGLIDWLIESELRQWQAASARLEERRRHHAERIIGTMGAFDLDRQRRLETVGRSAQRSLETYDRESEARRLAQSVRDAVTRTALVEVGALGLGTAVMMAASSQVIDITGLVAAGTLATLGLFILPARRRRAQRELEAKILALRTDLMAALRDQFERELDGSVLRIEEAVGPYTRFVRSEQQRLEATRDRLTAVKFELDGVGRRLVTATA